MAATDLEAQESFARARANSHQKDTDHAAHANPIDKSLIFMAFFYGFLPWQGIALGLKRRCL